MKYSLSDEKVSTYLLGFDIGGTSTRCVLVSEAGIAIGFAATTGGNPKSHGLDAFLRSARQSAKEVIQQSGINPQSIVGVNYALAGGPSPQNMPEEFQNSLSELGVDAPVIISSDALASFFSGTPEKDGLLLLSGTGAAALRVQDRECTRVVDGYGWLIGDYGSGFWFGRRAVCAVAEALTGRGEKTSLTDSVLETMGISVTVGTHCGRPDVSEALIDQVYSHPPLALAKLAPLVFRNEHDVVSRRIISEGATHLAKTLEVARGSEWRGPLVMSGGQLSREPRLRQEILALSDVPDEVPVTVTADGVVGCAVQALTAFSHAPTQAQYDRLATSISAVRQNN